VAQKLDDKELVSFKEMLIATSVMVDSLAQLLIDKGVISEQEFHTKLKQVQMDYSQRKAGRA